MSGAVPAPFDPEAVMDAMAPMLGLTIEAGARAAVAANLEVTARFAAIVLAVLLDDEAEPAPVFVP